MKVSELQGTALDWAVAKAEGHPSLFDVDVAYGMRAVKVYRPFDEFEYFEPSVNWEQGGPIIERYGIDVVYKAGSNLWLAYRPEARGVRPSATSTGPTPLIAAMRCYVVSELGDEIEIPEETITLHTDVTEEQMIEIFKKGI